MQEYYRRTGPISWPQRLKAFERSRDACQTSSILRTKRMKRKKKKKERKKRIPTDLARRDDYSSFFEGR